MNLEDRREGGRAEGKREGSNKATESHRSGEVQSAERCSTSRRRKTASGDDEVLIRVHAAGVDLGVWHLMTGLLYLVRAMATQAQDPHSWHGRRDCRGGREKCHPIQAGDLHGTCDGSFARSCQARERLAPKPANLSFEQAAAVPISGMTALSGLIAMRAIQPGQRVLVIGVGYGGDVRSAACQGSGGQQCVCSTSKAELVRDIGADEVIDYTREDFTEGTRQFDLILDTGDVGPWGNCADPRRKAVKVVGGEGGDRWLGGFQRQILPLCARSSRSRS